MSAVAGLMFVAGAYSAYQKQQSRYESADWRDKGARESLLTASYNIRERNKESRQTQFEIFDKAGSYIDKLTRAGLKAEGTGEVTTAASGVIVETGSSQTALSAILNEYLAEKEEVVLDAKHQIRSEARHTKNLNTSEWRSAHFYANRERRKAKQERKQANRQYKADIFSAGVNAYSAGSAVEGTGDVSKWGSKTPKDVKPVSTTKSITPPKVMETGSTAKKVAPRIPKRISKYHTRHRFKTFDELSKEKNKFIRNKYSSFYKNK